MPSSRSSFLCILALGLAAVGPTFAAGEKGVDKGEFLRAFQGPDSHAAGKMIEKLNPDVKGEYDLLKMVLAQGNWYYRAAAIKILAKTGNKKNVDDMIESLSDKGEKNPLVRQGMAIAIAKMNDKELYPKLFEALQDKDPRVRREAAHALRINKDKRSIEALINQWRKEKDPIVANYIRATLEDITKRFFGGNPEDWWAWWEAKKEEFEVGSTDEEAEKKAAEEGKKLVEGGTVARDVEITFSSRGIGAPVIVLPEYGHSNELTIPFFYEIEKQAKLFYMKLPKIGSFKNLKGQAGKPFYPIDQLVDAFDDFRKTTKSDKIAIMAGGMNAWIAMRYASKYPQRVSAIVFIAPISSNAEYGRASDRMIKQGQAKNDIELWHLGLTRSANPQTGESTHDSFHKEKQLAVPEGEQGGIGRKDFSVYFADQQDSLVDLLYPIHDDHPGDVWIPDFAVAKEPKVQVPVMITTGKHTIMTSVEDCQSIAKHYGAQLVVFDRSASLPMIEEPEKFNKTVVAFLKQHAKKTTKSDREKG